MSFIEHLIGLYSLSACSWLLLCIYCVFTIKRFIVKRYEEETDLLNTVFFKKHFTFARYQPGFLSSGLYSTHLLMCVWGWKIFSKRKIFHDIKNPEAVTQHFSRNEIRRVKILGFVIIVLIGHLVGLEVIEWMWPNLI